MIASVHNRDVSYFKNIIESTCRDIHVFIAQSNTSIYGDCGIFQPTKKDNMILGMMKGGINDSLLVEEIDIQGLRKFQMLTNEAQVGGKYKLTPPGIDSNIVKKRIENKLTEYFENKE